MSITEQKESLSRNEDSITLLQEINWMSQIKSTDSSSVPSSTLVIA